jgi:hypothetical protein
MRYISMALRFQGFAVRRRALRVVLPLHGAVH